jgi:hypothetical protein
MTHDFPPPHQYEGLPQTQIAEAWPAFHESLRPNRATWDALATAGKCEPPAETPCGCVVKEWTGERDSANEDCNGKGC